MLTVFCIVLGEKSLNKNSRLPSIELPIDLIHRYASLSIPMQIRLPNALTIFALVAVMCAQVFGLQQGYLCMCEGDAVVTEATHCHPVHASHQQESTDPCNEQHSTGTGDQTPHQPLKQDLKAATLTKTPVAPPVMVAIEPDDFLIELIARPQAVPVVSFEAPLMTSAPLPAALLVARCTVLLV